MRGHEIVVAPEQVDGEAHGDGRGARLLLHEQHLHAIGHPGLGRRRHGHLALGQGVEVLPHPLHEAAGVAAADAHHDGVPHVVVPVELADVVQRDGLDGLDVAFLGVLVRRALVRHPEEQLLGELLVPVVAPAPLELVHGLGLDPLEVLRVERRLQDRVPEQLVVRLQVVPVDATREGRHLLVDGVSVAGRHRVQLLQDLLVGVRGGRAVGQHGRREGGESFLPIRVVLRPDLHPDVEGDERGPGLVERDGSVHRVSLRRG